MTRSANPRLAVYAALAGFGLLAALVSGRAELAALGAPFGVYLTLALASTRAPELRVAISLDAARALEGQELGALVELSSPSGVERLELELVLPRGAELVDGGRRLLLRLRPGEQRELAYRLVFPRWGGYRVGAVRVRARDRWGLIVFEDTVDARVPVRVYPRTERLRSTVRAHETTPFSGNVVARAKGDGIEFADLRPFVPGDRVRQINWRASARRQALYVTESHPERATDVVLFLDSFAEARNADEGTIDDAVRATATLASAYLSRRNRVALVSFGGTVRWLTPATGIRQRYRIIDALIETEIVHSYAWKNIEVIPKRTLPSQALLIAVTPLIDQRTIDALLDVRARGFDLAVVDVSPVRHASRWRASVGEPAWRLWLMWREALRFRYERLGVAVVEWDTQMPVAAAVEGVRAYRRHGRLVRA
jgi:uncharacterized protein (DUF58 family)